MKIVSFYNRAIQVFRHSDWHGPKIRNKLNGNKQEKQIAGSIGITFILNSYNTLIYKTFYMKETTAIFSYPVNIVKPHNILINVLG